MAPDDAPSCIWFPTSEAGSTAARRSQRVAAIDFAEKRRARIRRYLSPADLQAALHFIRATLVRDCTGPSRQRW